MPNLTDYIEEYLKKMLALSPKHYIEVQRRELAGKFACVPSQINYVLERCFSPERGYLVESRRGGGGWIRIYRLDSPGTRPWRDALGTLNGEDFEPLKLGQILKRLQDEKIVSRRETRLLEAIIRDSIYDSCGISREKTRRLQRKLLGAVLEELLKAGF